MKRIGKKYRTRQKIVQKRIRRQDRKRKRVATRRKRAAARFQSGLSFRKIRGRLQLKAPDEINLYDEIPSIKFRKFLSKLKIALYETRARVQIDFRTTRLATAAAMLTLVAEVDRASRVLDTPHPVKCRPPKSELVQQVFKQVGLAKLLSANVSIPVTHRLVTVWQYETGLEAEGEIVDTLLSQVENRLGEDASDGLYVALTEALLNAIHHANPKDKSTTIFCHEGDWIVPRRWWLFGGIIEDRLSLVVSDMGMGIPRSLPIKWHENTLRQVSNLFNLKSNDSDYIRLSMELHRTRTAQQNRGRGMRQLRNAVAKAGDGYLAVYSNKGVYKFHGASCREETENFRLGISGTTIEWCLPLESAATL